MKEVLYPENSKKLDEYLIKEKHYPGVLLMENAAMAVATEIRNIIKDDESVLILCGKGNNGGDGYALTHILISYGIKVKCLDCSLKEHKDDGSDTEINYRIVQYSGEKYLDYIAENDLGKLKEYLSEYDIIVDALFGTGLNRAVDGFYKEVIELINSSKKRVVAVDIPSGVFGKTGQAYTAVNADLTVTFQTLKVGHKIYPGAGHCGEVKVYPIAVCDRDFHDAYYVDELSIPKRRRNTNKGSYGRLNIVAGSKGMAGAAVLCASASIRSGTGLTRLICPEAILDIVQTAIPEATCFACGNDNISFDSLPEIKDGALAVGPGLSKSDDIRKVVLELIKTTLPTVLDADALNNLTAEDIRNKNNIIITPHPKEFSRLFDVSVSEVLENPLGIAKKYAKEYGISILLKGASTVITNGEEVYIVDAGTPGMAKGGSGDVLTGCIGSFLAQGMDIIKAAYSASFICGKAAELSAEADGEYAIKASDTINNIGKVIKKYQEN